MEEPRNNRCRQSVFAPWRWSLRWKVRVLVLFLLLNEIVSGPPVFYLMHRGGRNPSMIENGAWIIVFLPVNVFATVIPPLKEFLYWELESLYRLEGQEPPIRIDT